MVSRRGGSLLMALGLTVGTASARPAHGKLDFKPKRASGNAQPVLHGKKHSQAHGNVTSGQGAVIGDIDSDSANARRIVIDPASPLGPLRRPMTAVEYQRFRDALERIRKVIKDQVQKGQPPLLSDRDWSGVPHQGFLKKLGITRESAPYVVAKPYFELVNARDEKGHRHLVPKKLQVVDHNHFAEGRTNYVLKTKTRYRTQHYRVPVYTSGGRCGCRRRLAYYTTRSRRVPYHVKVRVASSREFQVSEVTPEKVPKDKVEYKEVWRPRHYSVRIPVYTSGGRCGCRRRLAYYRNETRTQWVKTIVKTTKLVLKAQIPQYHASGKSNQFIPGDALRTLKDGKVTVPTDESGNVKWGSTSEVFATFSREKEGELFNNRKR